MERPGALEVDSKCSIVMYIVLWTRRVSDRIMGVKVEIRGVVFIVICAYAPQVGCHLEKRGEFWSKLDQVAESVPKGGKE